MIPRICYCYCNSNTKSFINREFSNKINVTNESLWVNVYFNILNNVF